MNERSAVTITRKVGESIYIDMPDGERIEVVVSSFNKSRQPRVTVIVPKSAVVTRGK